MSIDWITVAAQILNFLVLVWLLKRFLYRPILDGIDAREAEIAARMGEAAQVRETAEATEATYKAEVAALKASRADMIKEAHKAAEKERDALLSQARDRIDKEQADRDEHRADEAAEYSAALHQTGAAALLALTRKALSDLADETLERRIVVHAAKRIAERADDLRNAAGDSHTAVVLTRDPLPDGEQSLLRSEFASVLPGFVLGFETSPDIPIGLSLRLGGAQVEWTLDSYLSGLDDALEEISGRTIRKGLSDAA
jgi:F-type H+-transporting ATPase subunit b